MLMTTNIANHISVFLCVRKLPYFHLLILGLAFGYLDGSRADAGIPAAQGDAKMLKADSASERGDFEAAATALEAALSDYRQEKDTTGEFKALLRLARIYREA